MCRTQIKTFVIWPSMISDPGSIQSSSLLLLEAIFRLGRMSSTGCLSSQLLPQVLTHSTYHHGFFMPLHAYLRSGLVSTSFKALEKDLRELKRGFHTVQFSRAGCLVFLPSLPPNHSQLL